MSDHTCEEWNYRRLHCSIKCRRQASVDGTGPSCHRDLSTITWHDTLTNFQNRSRSCYNYRCKLLTNHVCFWQPLGCTFIQCCVIRLLLLPYISTRGQVCVDNTKLRNTHVIFTTANDDHSSTSRRCVASLSGRRRVSLSATQINVFSQSDSAAV